MDLDGSEPSAAYVAGIRFHDAIRLHDVHQHSFQGLVADVSAEIPQLLPALRDCVSRQLFAQLPLNGSPAQQLLARDALIEDLAGLYGSDALRLLMDFVEGFLGFVDADSVTPEVIRDDKQSVSSDTAVLDLCSNASEPWRQVCEGSEADEDCSKDSSNAEFLVGSVDHYSNPRCNFDISTDSLPVETFSVRRTGNDFISVESTLPHPPTFAFSSRVFWPILGFIAYFSPLYFFPASLAAPILLFSPFVCAWLLWKLIQSVSTS